MRPAPVVLTQLLLAALRAVPSANGTNCKHTFGSVNSPPPGQGWLAALRVACTTLWAAVLLIFGAWSHLCRGPLPPCPGLSLGNIKGTACLLAVGRSSDPQPLPEARPDFLDLPKDPERLKLKGNPEMTQHPPSPFPDKGPENLRGGDAEPTARVTRLGRS